MNSLLVLPILIPLATALLTLLLRNSRRAQRGLGATGAAALLLSGVWLLRCVLVNGIQVTHPGDWPAPYGIVLVADLFSSIMVVLAGLMGAAVAVYSLGSMDERRERHGYYTFLHIMLMGVCGAFLTGDLFNLYVWFEVMLIASFILMTLGGEKRQIQGGVKYVTLNLIASALFLSALGIVYGKTGTLNMADLAVKLKESMEPEVITVTAVLFLTAFGIKAGLFPLYFWLPASYHTPPVAVSAIFAGLLTKVGVYALVRVFTLIFTHDVPFTHELILVIGGLTMVTGVLGAIAQYDLRRLLSFHIISQIGYMVMGLALFTPLAIAGTVFYIVHHIIVKTNLFLVAGIANRIHGHYDLRKLGGLYKEFPFLSILFLIPALSLAGIPPLSGFFAKFALIKAGIEAEAYLIAGIALFVGLLTLYSMTKVWNEAFWKAQPAENESLRAGGVVESPVLLYGPVALLAVLTLLISFAPQSVFGVAMQAAEQLLEPSDYIDAVLQRQP